MCTWDSIWNQYKAQDHIAAWLQVLQRESAVLLAAALEEYALCAKHFVGLPGQGELDPQIGEAIRKAAHTSRARMFVRRRPVRDTLA